MKATLHKKQIWLAAAAVLLALCATVGTAFAYFTTYATAQGGYTLDLKKSTEITEELGEWKKIISIGNTGNVACYTRVRIFAGDEYALEITPDQAGDWTHKADGYWYYNAVLEPGASTTKITAEIKRADNAALEIPEGEELNIVVVQECTAVSYNPDGTAQPADWNKTLEENTGYSQKTGEGA